MIAQKFIAGKTIDEAVNTCLALNKQGFDCLLNYIGEHGDVPEVRNKTATVYTELLKKIAANGIKAGLSIKLSSFGLFSQNLHLGKTKKIFFDFMKLAKENNITVWFDAEELCWKQKTVEIIKELDMKHVVGRVLQAYDNSVLGELEEEFLNADIYWFRICKGAYSESSGVVFKDKQHIISGYKMLIRKLLGRSYLQVATHDREIINFVESWLKFRQEPVSDKLEFAMLLGVDMKLAGELLNKGFKVVIYIPFGEDIESYCVRRIIEKPKYILLPFLSILKAFK